MNVHDHRSGCYGARGRWALAVLAVAVAVGALPGAATANSPPQVSAVRALPYGPVADQRVLVRFNLADSDGDALHVTLQLFGNNGSTFLMQCTNTDPSPGTAFTVGTDRTIIWNAQAEYPGHTGSDYVLKVVADDGFVATPEGFVLVPPGTFMMGSPLDEPGHSGNENQHQVTLTHGFYMQTTEVTNQQYMEMAQWAYNQGYVTATSTSLGDNLDGSTQELLDLDGDCEISFRNGAFSVDAERQNYPVMEVTWYGTVAYCDWLSLQQGLPRSYNHGTWQCDGGNPYGASGYRLPTEAEWEYACRAGSTTAFANGPITQIYCGPVDPNLDLVGSYCGNSGGWTQPVARKLPNAWGLYDMHGNLLEWCNDFNSSDTSTSTDPVGPDTGGDRVARGGCFSFYAQYCRSAKRGGNNAYYSNRGFGFRPVKSAN